jgi:hypothetical protein
MARTRANSTAYVKGDITTASTLGTRWFVCTTAGTTTSSQPSGFTNASDGATVTDGTAKWKCHVCGGNSGMCRITDYSDTYSITFTHRDLLIVRTLGKPGSKFHEMSSDEPRAHDRRSASDVLQISAILFNTSMATEGNTLVDDIFKPQAGTNDIVIELTGFWSTLYGATWAVQGSGSSVCKITPVLGKNEFLSVNIQVREIKT